jgi:GNAT superfamily N-acetyltransferase
VRDHDALPREEAVTRPPDAIAAPDLPGADVVLRDGSTVRLRRATPADEPAIRVYLEGLSARSRHMRFGTAAPDLDAAAARAARPPSRGVVALLAIGGPSPHVVGDAGYEATDPERAEFAIAIADSHQGRGLGTHLLGHLARLADASGITVFDADVLPENGPMLEVFRESGLPVRVRSEPGFVKVEISTSLTPEARVRFERRDEIAAA